MYIFIVVIYILFNMYILIGMYIWHIFPYHVDDIILYIKCIMCMLFFNINWDICIKKNRLQQSYKISTSIYIPKMSKSRILAYLCPQTKVPNIFELYMFYKTNEKV